MANNKITVLNEFGNRILRDADETIHQQQKQKQEQLIAALEKKRLALIDQITNLETKQTNDDENSISLRNQLEDLSERQSKIEQELMNEYWIKRECYDSTFTILDKEAISGTSIQPIALSNEEQLILEHQSKIKTPTSQGDGVKNKGLIKQRHRNRDFFLADMFDYALKDDGASMEAPIFTLSTKPDLSVWTWQSKDKNKNIKVSPSVEGRATQFDKDVLIYVVSQLTEAMNLGRDDANNRTVRFTVYDYLIVTNRNTSGREYEQLQKAFERLAGTRITTDIKTGNERVKEGFGIIDNWRIVEKSKEDERMIAVEITLSKWLFNAVQAFEVLTIHPDYFRLRQPLARKIYEIVRKHCGHQTVWKIGLELLKEKCGSKSSLKEFRRLVKSIADQNILPEYKLSLSLETDQVIFYTRDNVRLSNGLDKILKKSTHQQ